MKKPKKRKTRKQVLLAGVFGVSLGTHSAASTLRLAASAVLCTQMVKLTAFLTFLANVMAAVKKMVPETEHLNATMQARENKAQPRPSVEEVMFHGESKRQPQTLAGGDVSSPVKYRQMIRVGDPDPEGDGWWMEDRNAGKESFPSLPSEQDVDAKRTDLAAAKQNDSSFDLAGDELSSMLANHRTKQRKTEQCDLMKDPESLKFDALYGTM